MRTASRVSPSLIEKERGPPHRPRSGKCPPRPQCRSLSGLALPQNRAVEDNRSIAHPRRLIPPPSGGSFEYFTSPTRGRARSPPPLDCESQEDHGGPQPTSSEGGRGDLSAAADVRRRLPAGATRRDRRLRVRRRAPRAGAGRQAAARSAKP